MSERLQKLMARGGYGSRRHCEKLIRAGRVRVNGRIARLGHRADPQHDLIEVDGKKLAFEEPLYIMLHKPKGVISSTQDELRRGRPTVRELVGVPGHLYPVGRLDRQSEGLILLTNDGHLAHRLTHPRFGHEKVYHVEVEGNVPQEKLDRWRNGVVLDGRRTAPAKVTLVRRTGQKSILQVTLREGRKRQIRRVSAALGHPVVRLVRKRIGPADIGDLAAGKWRYLTAQEVRALRESVSSSDASGREDNID
ncbi:MAG: rRNA pseudouridine synthase [Chloroflexota bacterium]|nr:MAG: rRNA pseudouridine synthase [Chloroflexota bacterium]